MEQQSYPRQGQAQVRRYNAFASASLIFGGISLLSCLVVYISVFFGCLSILFGLLSRQESLQMPGTSKVGCTLSAVAMVLSIVMTALAFVLLIQLFGLETVMNPEELLQKYSEYLNTIGGSL